MPIFVYRCGCGLRFERLVPRDAEVPACPQCGNATRKIPAGPSLARGGAVSAGSRSGPNGAGPSGSVPIPWRGVVRGGPENIQREVEFRKRLDAKAREGLRTPGGPDRPVPNSGGTGGPAAPPAAG